MVKKYEKVKTFLLTQHNGLTRVIVQYAEKLHNGFALWVSKSLPYQSNQVWNMPRGILGRPILQLRLRKDPGKI